MLKKPGPQRRLCKWCNEKECIHCRCPGHLGCDHSAGEQCGRSRYAKRLVCNQCVRNRLKTKKEYGACLLDKNVRMEIDDSCGNQANSDGEEYVLGAGILDHSIFPFERSNSDDWASLIEPPYRPANTMTEPQSMSNDSQFSNGGHDRMESQEKVTLPNSEQWEGVDQTTSGSAPSPESRRKVMQRVVALKQQHHKKSDSLQSTDWEKLEAVLHSPLGVDGKPDAPVVDSLLLLSAQGDFVTPPRIDLASLAMLIDSPLNSFKALRESLPVPGVPPTYEPLSLAEFSARLPTAANADFVYPAVEESKEERRARREGKKPLTRMHSDVLQEDYDRKDKILVCWNSLNSPVFGTIPISREHDNLSYVRNYLCDRMAKEVGDVEFSFQMVDGSLFPADLEVEILAFPAGKLLSSGERVLCLIRTDEDNSDGSGGGAKKKRNIVSATKRVISEAWKTMFVPQ